MVFYTAPYHCLLSILRSPSTSGDILQEHRETEREMKSSRSSSEKGRRRSMEEHIRLELNMHHHSCRTDVDDLSVIIELDYPKGLEWRI